MAATSGQPLSENKTRPKAASRARSGDVATAISRAGDKVSLTLPVFLIAVWWFTMKRDCVRGRRGVWPFFQAAWMAAIILFLGDRTEADLGSGHQRGWRCSSRVEDGGRDDDLNTTPTSSSQDSRIIRPEAIMDSWHLRFGSRLPAPCRPIGLASRPWRARRQGASVRAAMFRHLFPCFVF